MIWVPNESVCVLIRKTYKGFALEIDIPTSFTHRKEHENLSDMLISSESRRCVPGMVPGLKH